MPCNAFAPAWTHRPGRCRAYRRPVSVSSTSTAALCWKATYRRPSDTNALTSPASGSSAPGTPFRAGGSCTSRDTTTRVVTDREPRRDSVSSIAVVRLCLTIAKPAGVNGITTSPLPPAATSNGPLPTSTRRGDRRAAPADRTCSMPTPRQFTYGKQATDTLATPPTGRTSRRRMLTRACGTGLRPNTRATKMPLPSLEEAVPVTTTSPSPRTSMLPMVSLPAGSWASATAEPNETSSPSSLLPRPGTGCRRELNRSSRRSPSHAPPSRPPFGSGVSANLWSQYAGVQLNPSIGGTALLVVAKKTRKSGEHIPYFAQIAAPTSARPSVLSRRALGSNESKADTPPYRSTKSCPASPNAEFSLPSAINRATRPSRGKPRVRRAAWQKARHERRRGHGAIGRFGARVPSHHNLAVVLQRKAVSDIGNARDDLGSGYA